MPRLISADKLEHDMYHNAFEIDTDLQKWDSGCWIRYKMFENVIEKQPTVDAEPVRHGHWVKNDNGTYSCSECQSWIPNEQHYYARYCLYCGAKMDGEENEANAECESN